MRLLMAKSKPSYVECASDSLIENEVIDGSGRVFGKIGMPVASNVAGNRFLSRRRCNPHVEFLVYPAEIVQLSLIAVSTLLLAWNERGLWKFGSKPSTLCGAGLTPAGIDVSVFGNARKFKTLGSNLLSSTAVVELLSVKMRWKRLAGVRASYKPAEARITDRKSVV